MPRSTTVNHATWGEGARVTISLLRAGDKAVDACAAFDVICCQGGKGIALQRGGAIKGRHGDPVGLLCWCLCCAAVETHTDMHKTRQGAAFRRGCETQSNTPGASPAGLSGDGLAAGALGRDAGSRSAAVPRACTCSSLAGPTLARARAGRCRRPQAACAGGRAGIKVRLECSLLLLGQWCSHRNSCRYAALLSSTAAAAVAGCRML